MGANSMTLNLTGELDQIQRFGFNLNGLGLRYIRDCLSCTPPNDLYVQDIRTCWWSLTQGKSGCP